MIEKKSFKDGVQFAWDSTSIGLAQACPRKYYYRMIEGVAPKTSSVHLLFGGIYASALENFYKHIAAGDSVAEAQIKVVRQALDASWDRENSVPKHFDDPKKTRISLIRTIIWYIEEFADESKGFKTYHLENGDPAVELSFAFEINDDLILCGHLDRVVSLGDDLYVMDQKTTGGTVGPYFFNKFTPDNQMTLYSLAGRVILNTPVKGVVIDAAQIMQEATRFERGFTTRTEAQINEWLDSTLETIYRTQKYTREENFPMNLASCGNYGGCEFREICARSPGVRKNYIKTLMSSHNWDPLEAR